MSRCPRAGLGAGTTSPPHASAHFQRAPARAIDPTAVSGHQAHDGPPAGPARPDLTRDQAVHAQMVQHLTGTQSQVSDAVVRRERAIGRAYLEGSISGATL